MSQNSEKQLAPQLREEADRLARLVENQPTLKEGVLRWKSNGRVPFDAALVLADNDGLPVDFEKGRAARRREMSRSAGQRPKSK